MRAVCLDPVCDVRGHLAVAGQPLDALGAHGKCSLAGSFLSHSRGRVREGGKNDHGGG